MTEYEASLKAEREWVKSFSCPQVTKLLSQKIGISRREAAELFDSCKDYLLLQRLSAINAVPLKPPTPLIERGISIFASFTEIYNQFSSNKLGINNVEIYTARKKAC